MGKAPGTWEATVLKPRFFVRGPPKNPDIFLEVKAAAGVGRKQDKCAYLHIHH